MNINRILTVENVHKGEEMVCIGDSFEFVTCRGPVLLLLEVLVVSCDVGGGSRDGLGGIEVELRPPPGGCYRPTGVTPDPLASSHAVCRQRAREARMTQLMTVIF